MVKIDIVIETPTDDEMAAVLEQIAWNIRQGMRRGYNPKYPYPAPFNWELEGKEE
jgi:hypothetical protein